MQPGLGRPCSAEASQTATMLPSAVAFIYFYAMTTMSFLPLAKSKGSQLLQKVTCLGSTPRRSTGSHGRCGLGCVRPPPHQPHPPDRGAACHPVRDRAGMRRVAVGGVHDGAVDPQDFYAYQVRMRDALRDRH